MEALLSNASFTLPDDLYAVPLELDFLLPTSERTARLVLFGFIAGFGVLANLASMVVLVTGKLVKQWTYAMLLNVTVCDLVFCLIVFVAYLPGVVLNRFPFPGVACYIRLGLMLTCAGGAIFSYLLMAVHRFVVIVLNRPRMRIFTVPWLALLLPCLWLVAVVAISPYYYLGDVFVVYWRDNCFPWSPGAVEVMEIITLVYIYLPSVVSCTLYVAIYVVVRKSSARIQTAGKRERKEVKMALVLFGLLTLFIVAYFPYCTFLSFQRYMSVQSQKLYLLTGLFTAITISACNPLVFAAIFKPMQKRYLEICGCKKLATNKVSVAPATDSTNTTNTTAQ